MRDNGYIEYFRHSLGDEEKARVLAALDQTILTTGDAVAEAERALSDYLGVSDVVCLDSCTAALHMALLAHNIGAGDEVVVPAMTFVATANAVLMAGAKPRFADVDAATGCVTVETVQRAVSRRTRAIIPVHLYGLLCDMEALATFAADRDIIVIEDSAHCLEARRGKVRPGSHSRCACFSFYATKAITCGEGGAVATNDSELAAQVRTLALHGLTTSATDRYRKPYRHWDMDVLGWKYNLDNIRGSLLLPQIAKLDAHCQRRREIAARYDAAFDRMDGVDKPVVPDDAWTARHLYTIWVDADRRDAIIAALQQQGIGVVVTYRPVPLMRYYARRYGFYEGDFPAAEAMGARTISLPIYPQLTDLEVDRVIEAVARATKGAGKIDALMAPAAQ